MCRLRNFLCCLSLETGGIVIGWFNIIIWGLAFIGWIVLLSVEIVEHDSNQSNGSIIGGYITLIIVYSIFILYAFLVFIASVMLVQGTRRRDHSKMVLFMLIMAIGVVLQFLQVLVSGWATFISGLFFACLSLYWFLCIYSLYHKIKDESMGRPYV